MGIALIAAKVLGIYLIISGLFLMFRGKTLPHLLKDFFGHPAIVYLSGVLLIFFSSFFLLQNNIWNGSWQTLITVLMWGILIKGVMYILAPQMLERMVTKKLLASVNLYGIVALVAGVYLFFIR